MICFPNCKINLGLFITRKRDDGYHDLETVFYPVKEHTATALNDVLEVVPARTQPQLYLSGLGVNGDINDNLVYKAYYLLKDIYGDKVPALDIYLHKVIPMGAGLGGGSADGAYMLQLLNDYCGLGLTQQELAAHALSLGSDCPFFIYNTPQFATGRGEEMTPMHLDISGYDIKVICPGVHVSTREAFSLITPRPAPFDLRHLSELSLQEWKKYISNDFEGPVFCAHPELAAIKQQLYGQGAVYASMTGSGSAIYGLFPKGGQDVKR